MPYTAHINLRVTAEFVHGIVEFVSKFVMRSAVVALELSGSLRGLQRAKLSFQSLHPGLRVPRRNASRLGPRGSQQGALHAYIVPAPLTAAS